MAVKAFGLLYPTLQLQSWPAQLSCSKGAKHHNALDTNTNCSSPADSIENPITDLEDICNISRFICL
ncbi:hypothetical protein HBI25_216550 [Parastagonospora nodorum]|nr:hypothetical protein HBH52_251020 [Parastagonospora nodorum]KAH4009555.1 hypothetical protein HBI09_235140 [Parastagonospora nodorum]KAH4088638.1 hypothetical protein HBH48_116750 [Parastagonospora nodorum]KAH4182922.1 hypothetical protein HBH42_211400 [Parastagonospora nodorum]KAH4192184.1 hypothetical protein HBI95_208530 [Parastagonospora nodorum]